MVHNFRHPALTNQKPQEGYPLIPQTDTNNLKFISFSFRYFSERKFFGIGDTSPEWFKNLYHRLIDLSVKTASILEDYNMRTAYRLHPIDWDAKNCPIKIDDLDRIPQKIREKAADNFFWQFQLSQGTGRVVGFFNEEHSIFYIVLLDFKHNIQPSKRFGYSVDDTEFAMTEYEKIQAHILELESKRIKCRSQEICPIKNLNSHISPEAIFVNIEPELVEIYEGLLRNGTFCDKFNLFLLENFS